MLSVEERRQTRHRVSGKKVGMTTLSTSQVTNQAHFDVDVDKSEFSSQSQQVSRPVHLFRHLMNVSNKESEVTVEGCQHLGHPPCRPHEASFSSGQLPSLEGSFESHVDTK